MRGWSFVQDYTRKESNLKNASDSKYLKGCPCFYYYYPAMLLIQMRGTSEIGNTNAIPHCLFTFLLLDYLTSILGTVRGQSLDVVMSGFH